MKKIPTRNKNMVMIDVKTGKLTTQGHQYFDAHEEYLRQSIPSSKVNVPHVDDTTIKSIENDKNASKQASVVYNNSNNRYESIDPKTGKFSVAWTPINPSKVDKDDKR